MRPGFLIACAVYLIVGLVLAHFAGADFGGLGGKLWWLALGFALYFLPAIVAAWRHHPSADAITALNLLLGWTGIGWLILLVWARPLRLPMPQMRRPCPHCAEAILPAAKVCRYCGSRLSANWAAGAEIVPLPLRRAP